MQLIVKVVLLLLLPAVISAQPENAAFKNLTPAEGLPTTSVTDVTQDAFGLIWIGSWDGVYRYDGRSFTRLSLKEDGRYLTADTQGGVWISFDKSIAYYNPYIDRIKTYTIPYSGRFPSIAIDDADRVWVASDNGVLYFDPSSDSLIFDTGQQSGYVFGMTAVNDGNLLFVLRQKIEGNNHYQIGKRNSAGKYSYEPLPEDLNNPQKGKSFSDRMSAPQFLRHLDSTGMILVNSFGWAYKPLDGENWVFNKPLVENFSLESTDARLDNNGHLWLNQVNQISKLDIASGKITVYQNDPKNPHSILPLTSVNVGNNMFFDRQGVLWITRFSYGISRLNLYESDFGLLKDSTGSPVPDVLSALELKDGSFWIGTRADADGLIHFSAEGKILQRYGSGSQNSPPGKSVSTYLNHPFALSLAESQDGSIWAGGWAPSLQSGGVSRIRPGTDQITIFKSDPNDPSSISDDRVGKIVVDGSDRVWIASHGVLSYIDPVTENVTRWYMSTSSDTADQSVDWLKFATASGDLIFEKTGRTESYLIDHTTLTAKPFGITWSEDDRIHYVHQDDNGKIWYISNEGFGCLDSTYTTSVYFYNIKTHYFPANEIEAIQSDKEGHIWLATDNGIIQFDPLSEHLRHFDFNRGLQGNSFDIWDHVGYKGPSGKIYFGGNGGVNIFDPEAIKANPYPPEMVFTGLTLNGKPITPGENSAIRKPIFAADNITLDPDVLTISIDFAAIHFAGNKSNQYRYKLEGFDQDWRNGGTIGNATYTNLSPGTYTLSVKGSNWDGVWSDGKKSIKIRVLPPWWQTWWAYSLYGLLFLFLLWQFFRYQKNRTIAKERARTQLKELEQAKKIEKAYNELQATQQQLIQSEKMASLGEMTAGIAHEIQNPLNFVNNFSEVNKELLEEIRDALSNNNSEEATSLIKDAISNEEKITLHGKRADTIVKSMLMHSRSSSGQKELTDLNALCDEYLRLSYHGLRAKDKSFNADFHTDLDPALPKIEVVPQDIGRVLLNLINNAFYAVSAKASASTSSATGVSTGSTTGADTAVTEPVEVPASKTYKPTITITTKNLGSTIEIRVKDNGNGIPQDVQDKIFQPFFTTKPTGQGTGLGLSLSYDIVKAHGGTITLESKLGTGTTFIVLLPYSGDGA